MAYSADTFVADEQPTTAKWNKLWTNDASFNDGTGIATGAITSAKISGIDKSLTTTDSNPYKFSAYRNAAYNTVTTTQTRLPFDSEKFDTNSNFDVTTNPGRYTVPVTGFYMVTGNFTADHDGFLQAILFKNGAAFQFGTQDFYDTGQATGESMSALTSLTAADYIELFYYCDGVKALSVGTTANQFSGFLVSRT